MNENNNYDYGNQYNNPPDFNRNQKPGKKPWKKGLIIFAIVFICIVILGAGCSRLINSVLGTGKTDNQVTVTGEYIGVLEVNGVMGEEGHGSPYNQEWLLSEIDEMENDSMNKGMMLSINTPGGSVYDIDEVYLKILEYKETTGRPVYTYMRDMAASGGYYISAPSDKIYANRNTWTGSIGVTVGTFMDASEFLNKMGIKTVTITAGDNKAMGSATEPMTEEQKAIFQGLVDEAYEQFTQIVADGRKMDIEKVKKLADGRVYTARQAKEHGLIDEIGTIEDALGDMAKRYELEECETPVFRYEPETSILDMITGKFINKKEGNTEIDQIKELIEENNKFTISYIANIKR